MHFFKKMIIFAIIAGVFYLLLGYHYIIIGNSLKILKKSELTLKYTFFSTKNRTLKSIFSIEELWNDGIGELMLEEGKISKEKLRMYKIKIDGEDEDYY